MVPTWLLLFVSYHNHEQSCDTPGDDVNRLYTGTGFTTALPLCYALQEQHLRFIQEGGGVPADAKNSASSRASRRP